MGFESIAEIPSVNANRAALARADSGAAAKDADANIIRPAATIVFT